MRNVLVVVVADVVAAALAVFGPVAWAHVLLLAMFAGMYVGPAVARRLSTTLLRWAIAATGLALAVAMALGAL